MLFYPLLTISAQEQGEAPLGVNTGDTISTPLEQEEVIPQATPAQDNRFQEDHFADPFSPISQFDPAEIDEEEEVNERFYDYGRLIHIAFGGNLTQPVGPFSTFYTTGWMLGVRFTYFLDWNLGLTFHTGLGRSSISYINPNPLTSPLVPEFTGKATLFDLGFGIKFYPNFHDISSSIAWLNPSILLGLELFVLNDELNDQDLETLKAYNINDPSHRVTAPAVFMGMGLDIPLLRKVVYLGLEFMFHVTFFPSYNYRIEKNDPHFGEDTGLDYSGRFLSYGAHIIWNI